jgi:hypothetical protein
VIAPELPAAARTLLRQLDGWSTKVTHATGPCAFGGLSEGTDGNGKRRRIEVVETVESVVVRAAYVDGRALVALWIRRPGKGWKLDLAWRGRHPGDHTPRPLTATELKAYVAGPVELEAAA